MTGFATRRGDGAGASWVWDLRGVNGRGLDLRLRVPDWIDGLEPALRAALAERIARGSISLVLRVQRDGAAAVPLDSEALEAALRALVQVRFAAEAHGLDLAPDTAAAVLAMRGVRDAAMADDAADTAPLRAALLADLPALIGAFAVTRAGEGRALATVIGGQIDRIDALTVQARAAAAERKDEMAAGLRANLARVLENADGADAGRVAQELAMIAVKADVTEELDRLDAHVVAARGLLRGGGPVGRRLDFLMQEFNREANTLCAKAQSATLTAIGLDLKAVIDQMREQVANVE